MATARYLILRQIAAYTRHQRMTGIQYVGILPDLFGTENTSQIRPKNVLSVQGIGFLLLPYQDEG
jgi:hypothetical protein